jgi:hypothetical protein
MKKIELNFFDSITILRDIPAFDPDFEDCPVELYSKRRRIYDEAFDFREEFRGVQAVIVSRRQDLRIIETTRDQAKQDLEEIKSLARSIAR